MIVRKMNGVGNCFIFIDVWGWVGLLEIGVEIVCYWVCQYVFD